MPSDWLYIDTAFPSFTGEESVNEKISTIQNYLFMLVEQLRYTLHNLDLSNMNSTAVSAWAETITEPIYAQIADDEGNLAQLALTAQGLAAQISDAEGNISALQLTASSLTTQISNAQGDISILYQTADTLASQISDAEGNVSTLYQTAEALATRISDAEGNISTLTQTAAGLTTRVSDAEGNISALQETATSITSMVTDLEGNFSILQQTVNGLTYTDASGTTYINGSCVYTANLVLTGCISWADLNTVLQSDINVIADDVDTALDDSASAQKAADNAQSTADAAYALAASIEIPSYIKSTYIDSTKILSPYIYGGLFYATGQGRNSEAAYYILDGCTIGDDGTVTPGNLCGYLSYDSNGAGTTYEAEKRVFLTTVDGVALKLQADGNMSLGAGGGLIYVDQGTSFTLGGALIGSEGELYGDAFPDSPSTGQLFFLLA